MAKIRAFRSLHYNTNRFSDLSPYLSNFDLQLDESNHLPKRRLYHIEKILLGIDGSAEADRFNVARKLLSDFKQKKVLVRDDAPFIYVYHVYYQHKISGLELTRKGFIALGKIEDYPILQELNPSPQQQSTSLKLLQSTMTLFSPIVMLYKDKKDQINTMLDEACHSQEPCIEVKCHNNEIHRVYRITNHHYLKKLHQIMLNREIMQMNIDPGYSALQEFKKEMSKKKFQLQWAMMLFFNVVDSTPFQTPNRLIKKVYDAEKLITELKKWFDFKLYPFTNQQEFRREKIEFFEDLRIEGYGHKHFGFYLKGHNCFQLLKMKEDRVKALLSKMNLPDPLPKLDPAILDQILFHKLAQNKIIEFDKSNETSKNIRYMTDLDDALHKIEKEDYDAVFFLNSITPYLITDILQNGCHFPKGSLDLSISPLAGLLMQPLEDEGETIRLL